MSVHDVNQIAVCKMSLTNNGLAETAKQIWFPLLQLQARFVKKSRTQSETQ